MYTHTHTHAHTHKTPKRNITLLPAEILIYQTSFRSALRKKKNHQRFVSIQTISQKCYHDFNTFLPNGQVLIHIIMRSKELFDVLSSELLIITRPDQLTDPI